MVSDIAIIAITEGGTTLGPIIPGITFVYIDPVTGNLTRRRSNGTTISLEDSFSGDYNDLSNLPTLGSAAAEDITAFASAAQGGLADTALQPGDNISDLANDAGYLITETVTQLQIIGNTLRFTDENGVDTDIDLSTYLDDTNLARLESGTVDANGIATFTRDDNSTFQVDFSGLIDPNQDTDTLPNVSSVAGTTTSDALEGLAASIALKADTAALSTVAFSGDYNDLSNLPILGSAAFANVGDFATAGQGALADSAVQPGDNVSDLNNDANYYVFPQPQQDIVDELPAPSAGNANTIFIPQINAAGDGYTYFTLFEDFIKSTTPLMNQTTTFEDYLSGTFDLPVLGDYIVETSFMWSVNTTGNDFEARLLVDGAEFFLFKQEPQDAGGAGIDRK